MHTVERALLTWFFGDSQNSQQLQVFNSCMHSQAQPWMGEKRTLPIFFSFSYILVHFLPQLGGSPDGSPIPGRSGYATYI